MKIFVCVIVIILLIMSLTGCSLSSSVIRGYVVMRTPSETHINLGSADGVHLGDTLTAFRADPGAPGVRSVRVGLVRVTKIMSNSYSEVEVLRGTLYERDIVEKRVR